MTLKVTSGSQPVERMPHGYTNDTVRSGSVVTKDYQGPGAARRCGREAAALAGSLPVPPLVEVGDTRVSMGLMAGVPGQDLIDAGLARGVLRACGRMLRRIQATDPGLVLGGARGGGRAGARGLRAEQRAARPGRRAGQRDRGLGVGARRRPGRGPGLVRVDRADAPSGATPAPSATCSAGTGTGRPGPVGNARCWPPAASSLTWASGGNRAAIWFACGGTAWTSPGPGPSRPLAQVTGRPGG